MIACYMGMSGIRFTIVCDEEEAENSCHNSENWQTVDVGELPVIKENIDDILQEIKSSEELA